MDIKEKIEGLMSSTFYSPKDMVVFRAQVKDIFQEIARRLDALNDESKEAESKEAESKEAESKEAESKEDELKEDELKDIKEVTNDKVKEVSSDTTVGKSTTDKPRSRSKHKSN